MNKKQRDKDYNKLVEQMSPKHKLFQNSFRAFWVGGVVCIIGQFFINTLIQYGVDKEDASTWASIILVFLAALLTGLDIFNKIGKYAGAGTIVPITGFANSIAAPAIEYKKEGQVFGIGSKIFTIAGPVILYGITTSIIVGTIYYIIKLVG